MMTISSTENRDRLPEGHEIFGLRVIRCVQERKSPQVTPSIYFIYTMTLCQEIWTVKETQNRQNRGTHLTGIKKLTQA